MNNFGKIFLKIQKKDKTKENWYNYVYIDKALYVYRETTKAPRRIGLEISTLKSEKYVFGMTANMEYIAFNITNFQFSTFDEHFIIIANKCDYILEEKNNNIFNNINNNEKYNLDKFDEIEFIGGGIKNIYSSIEESIDFDLQIDYII